MSLMAYLLPFLHRTSTAAPVVIPMALTVEMNFKMNSNQTGWKIEESKPLLTVGEDTIYPKEEVSPSCMSQGPPSSAESAVFRD